MASAAQLNATLTIVNGQGLGVNPALLANLAEFQAHTTISTIKNIYSDANLAVGNVIASINNIGSGVTNNLWVIDYYPSNITPASSAGISAWAPNTAKPVGSFITNGGKLYTVTGNVYSDSFGNVITNVSLAGVSDVVKKQGTICFDNGMVGFANVFTVAQGYATSVFDTVSSVHLLKDKTYGSSGLGYKNQTDLVTGGVGNTAPLLGGIVGGWGTMYNITNINLITDPYVFGQNLLNQNLGSYGNLSDNLAATGLDPTDITKVPQSSSTTSHTPSSITSQSFVGEVDLPIIANVTTTTTVTGNSPNVVMAIYANITGANLASIVSATGFTSTNTKLKTLADYLDFNKVIDSTLLLELQNLGINNFNDFTTYLNSRVGQGFFKSWAALATFLNNLQVPVLGHTTTTADQNVLTPSAAAALNAHTGTGSGPFNNPVMTDYFGALAGIPYASTFQLFNKNYSIVAAPIIAAFAQLQSAITSYVAAYNAWSATGTPNTAIPPDPDNSSPPVGDPPSTSGMDSAVNTINSLLNSTTGAGIDECNSAYYQMLNQLATEVNNLIKAGVVFGPAPANLLFGFGQRIGSLGAVDKTGLESDKIITNIITIDAAGDTIRAVIAESNNITILGTSGITMGNDPNPRQIYSQATSQNIPISTYISQNK